nr:MAG TPA: zinc-ribbon containing domain protein [Caudoviricetes sp.]
MYCGKCGFGANEPSYTFCPNCGTRYIRTKNACLEF